MSYTVGDKSYIQFWSIDQTSARACSQREPNNYLLSRLSRLASKAKLRSTSYAPHGGEVEIQHIPVPVERQQRPSWGFYFSTSRHPQTLGLICDMAAAAAFFFASNEVILFII
jgi:hypothetical protein